MVRFLATTLSGARLEVGPFTHITVTPEGSIGYSLSSADPIKLVRRDRNKFLFEESDLALAEFDVIDDSEGVAEVEEPVEDEPTPAPKPKRKYKRRKKAAELEAAGDATVAEVDELQAEELEAE